MSNEKNAKDWVESWVRWHHDDIIENKGKADIGGELTFAAMELGLDDEEIYPPMGEFWVGIASYFAARIDGIWGEWNVLRIMREQNVTRNTAVYVWKSVVRLEERKEAKRREEADINAALGIEPLI